MNRLNHNPRVLIVAESASHKLGGEAALPLNYFIFLRKRGIEAWLVVHERTRPELEAALGDEMNRVTLIPDNWWFKLLWFLGKPLPWRLALFSTQFLLRLSLQICQRRVMRELIARHSIQVVHQPMPVSPKEPSLFYNLGVPVVIGPMNGGMIYPPSFSHLQSVGVSRFLEIGTRLSGWLNHLIPGKREAAILLVANQRTRLALPPGLCPRVIELTENGVDLSLWLPKLAMHKRDRLERLSQLAPIWEKVRRVKFVFVGRLMSWKAVDLLLLAFHRVNHIVPIELDVIGDGPDMARLREQTKQLGLESVTFTGWLSQSMCAERLLNADVLVLPSLLEAGGAVILEAMAIGLPVIATRWGGPMDYVNSSCGILVEPTDPEAFVQGLADAMLRLARSKEERLAMGQVGRERVVQYFDWEAKVEQILDIYSQAIATQAIATVSYQASLPELPEVEVEPVIKQLLS
jgi:glycosyltransferase involved in cell wall biosynthesis